jgi:hypothetical protein
VKTPKKMAVLVPPPIFHDIHSGTPAIKPSNSSVEKLSLPCESAGTGALAMEGYCYMVSTEVGSAQEALQGTLKTLVRPGGSQSSAARCLRLWCGRRSRIRAPRASPGACQ